MPTYDYFCQACGKQSEISHRMSDPNATVCPLCGEPALVKQMSAPAFRLKGGGWYETDFKSEGKRNLAEGSDAVAPPAAVKAGDTKPAEAAKPAAEAKPAAAKPAESGASSSGSTSPAPSTTTP